MKLTYGEILLLRHTLTATGEVEVQKDKDGKDIDVPSSRKLNNEESAQRRHFTKAVQSVIENIQEMSNTHNKLVEEVRTKYREENKIEGEQTLEENKYISEDESVKESFESVKKFLDDEHDVEVTDKTMKVLKKYFKLFGDEAGFVPGDDSVVESIENKLK